MHAKQGTATRADCVVVGGGPAGATLSLLLVRKGVRVTLLEAHPDFDREFRGDTLHPSAMELMEDLGLAGKLLKLRHSTVRSLTLQTASGPLTPVDLSRLRTEFPYITLMPQKSFLEFITREASRYPTFRLVMEARVRELVEAEGVVGGVRYEGRDGRLHEVRSELVIGADGRGSRVRRLAGLTAKKTSPPMDVLWFRLPRKREDPEGAVGRFGRGRIAILLDRLDWWQCGYVIPKGTYPELRRAGVEKLRRDFAGLVPEFADRVEHLKDLRQASLLSVESSLCPRWYRPGLVLIGDAAHVMSPVGGVGINYALQDAVAAANILTGPLLAGRVRERDLARLQRRRKLPTRAIQLFQSLVQKNLLARALDPQRPFDPPAALRLALRLPGLRSLPARIVGFGLRPERIR
ncbi:2-polyprenyl-6-methoxyphenol hydroxylase and related FAD-dependent oxidoreductase [Rubrobacter radiotolerans]|uniref:FAD-dependent oxidoreductase n=1 Tax=Rubrobacter radiotolerans TaxID=42256 RepID=A0A023X623_RUBRA|nr:FAD-dependent oxidoreductase [Rubrobacter radiotolerans]AHY47646.1 2-polyprenyl-6-methoxyphenol hydroxylase and related FAD-dependent oxidoreductase [Rubrobacter radiotolerans]MDX5895049.1 FAD-dependent oxidoreductase [Rubrobacter radiotolerans]SMC07345.1 2-polyprenyl-6-methoxyphenol hydroxylase [Rubrobacter radiotolerans DSM 5868]